MRNHLVFIFEPIKNGINALVEAFSNIFGVFPPVLFIAIVAFILYMAYDKKSRAFCRLVSSPLFLWNQGVWEDMISTLSLVVVSALLAIILGIPLGI